MICDECGKAEYIETHENHRYLESGLPNIVLESVLIRRCPACGSHLVTIPRMTELHRSVAVRLIKKRARLAPQEVTFLRKSLNWSKPEFAKKMHVKQEQIYRWESLTNHKPMMIQSELLLRAFVALDKKINDYDDQVDDSGTVETPDLSPFSMVFNKGWHDHSLLAG